MNTADRSIALVDAAMRRRFPFDELHPQREPVKGVLAEFAKRKALTDDRVELLEELNAAMGQRGHDLHIGPSYLMRDGLDEPGALDLVWRYDILPLLHEHFYGSKSPEVIDQEFGLASLRKRIEHRPQADESPDDRGRLMGFRHESLDELDAEGIEVQLGRRPGEAPRGDRSSSRSGAGRPELPPVAQRPSRGRALR